MPEKQRSNSDILQLPYLVSGLRFLQLCRQWLFEHRPSESSNIVLFIGLWWILCSRIWSFVLYVIPALPLVWASHTWQLQKRKVSKSETTPHICPEEDTQKVFQFLVALDRGIGTIAESLRWSNPAKTRRVFIALVYLYILWVTAHQVLDTRYIVFVVGLLKLTWNNPWFGVLRERIRYPAIRSIVSAIFVDQLQDGSDNANSLMNRAQEHLAKITNSGHINDDQSQFTFMLFENQRCWPSGQWQNRTFFFERSPWSDESNTPVLPKSAFSLPPPVEMTVSDPAKPNVEYKKSWTWVWIDAEWRLDLEGDVDELGWEYGTITWTMFGRQPKGWLSTRRRRWVRRAKVDYRVHAMYKEDKRSSIMSNSTLQSTTQASFVMASEEEPASPIPTASRSMPRRLDIRPVPAADSFVSSSPLTPMSAVYNRRLSSQDGIPIPRQSFSTTSVNGMSQVNLEDLWRRRGSAATTSSINSHNYPAIGRASDWTGSQTSIDKRSSGHSRSTSEKKRREAVWKSIIRT